jgi:hypothetical protein
VLDERGVGPKLCLGAVFESDPPKCWGIPLVGWDWAKLEGERARDGTTWGDYHVVGTYDGKRLTLTEPAGPPRHTKTKGKGYAYKFGSACREPTGGWARPDLKRTDRADLVRLTEAAQKVPSFSALWLTYLVPAKEDTSLKDVVVNVTFTGDVARREAELRKLWGGVLCVAQQKHSEAELMAIRVKAEAMIREMGIEAQGSDMDVIHEKILVAVTTVTADQLARLDEKFGEMLLVTALLRPVP